jgi:hypothetical protein
MGLSLRLRLRPPRCRPRTRLLHEGGSQTNCFISCLSHPEAGVRTDVVQKYISNAHCFLTFVVKSLVSPSEHRRLAQKMYTYPVPVCPCLRQTTSPLASGS